MKNIIIFPIISMIAVNSVLAASFDCKKAGTVVEKAICNNVQVSEADGKLGDIYSQLKKSLSKAEFKQLKVDQRDWLKKRNTCGGDTLCLMQMYEQRISELSPEPKQKLGFREQDVSVQSDEITEESSGVTQEEQHAIDLTFQQRELESKPQAEELEHEERKRLFENIESSLSLPPDVIDVDSLFAERGEFETKEEYEKRLAKFDSKKIYFLDFPLKAVSYDIDSQILFIKRECAEEYNYDVECLASAPWHYGSPDIKSLILKHYKISGMNPLRVNLISNVNVKGYKKGNIIKLVEIKGDADAIYLDDPWHKTMIIKYSSFSNEKVANIAKDGFKIFMQPEKAKGLRKNERSLNLRIGFNLCGSNLNCRTTITDFNSVDINDPFDVNVKIRGTVGIIESLTIYYTDTKEHVATFIKN